MDEETAVRTNFVQGAMRLLLLTGVALAATLGALPVAAGNECEALDEGVQFVGAEGQTVDIAHVDAIAYRRAGTGIVVVYQRTDADAAALVSDLAASGESDPHLLDAKSWLVAQVAGCNMKAGKCSGVCTGKKTCNRIKKAGKDICQCMLRGG